MLIQGMYGMGDCIFQRAFLREMEGPIYLRTTWPQIYRDLPHILPTIGKTRLRTQHKNVEVQPPGTWHAEPQHIDKRIQYHHGNCRLQHTTIMDAMGECLGVKPKIFDLPVFDERPVDGAYAVIRPVTIRQEWANIARGPYPRYISQATEILKRRGLKTVSIADLQDGYEWAEELPDCDIKYNHGELKLEEVLGLIQGAKIVVGGVGWIVPAAIASGIPLICVLGGQGGHNAPEKVTGPPMDLSKTRWIYPDKYCMCIKMQHRCNKKITNFESKFKEAMEDLY